MTETVRFVVRWCHWLKKEKKKDRKYFCTCAELPLTQKKERKEENE